MKFEFLLLQTLTKILLDANESSKSKEILMVQLNVTKRVLSLKDTIKRLALIIMKHIALWSNLLPFDLFFPWLPQAIDPCANWTLIMSFSIVTLKNKSLRLNHQDLWISLFQIMYVF
jgi:hypothetical protein